MRVVESWRRLRDSNPGDALTPNGFQDRRIRPLCQTSGGRFLDRCPRFWKRGTGKSVLRKRRTFLAAPKSVSVVATKAAPGWQGRGARGAAKQKARRQ